MNQFEEGAKFLRAELNSLKARLSAPALIAGLRDQEFWFENMLENGGFDSDTIWTKGTGWSIGSGVATHASGTASQIDQAISFNQAKSLVVGGSVSSRTAGNIKPRLTGGSTADGAEFSSNGAFSQVLNALVGHDTFGLYGSTSFDGSIDNAYAYDSDGTDIIHRMPNGWKPHRVFVDGLLQREGAAHDYETKLDPEGYYIVPAVAPGALTETCILGVRV